MSNIFIALGILFYLTTLNAVVIKSNEGMFSFASDLYQKLPTDSNIIISPLSISTAIALISQGAQADTFNQIAHGLKLGNDKSTIATNFVSKLNALNQAIGEATLTISNQIYVKEGKTIKQSFKDVAVNKFNSGIETINFTPSTIAALKINKFVDEKTNGKIKNLFADDSFDDSTVMVVANAIHFKGNWEKTFEFIYHDKFYLDEIKTVNVEIMKNSDDYRYASFDDLAASACEFKIQGSSVTFMILLPNSKTGLTNLEETMKNVNLSKITNELKSDYVDVILPKFKIEYAIELNDVLKELGMNNMFGDNADFSELLESHDSLKVSKVIHKAFIDVNERGIEAAAATGISFVNESLLIRNQQPKIFHANHPFLFYILDSEKEIVLFNGRYMN